MGLFSDSALWAHFFVPSFFLTILFLICSAYFSVLTHKRQMWDSKTSASKLFPQISQFIDHIYSFFPVPLQKLRNCMKSLFKTKEQQKKNFSRLSYLSFTPVSERRTDGVLQTITENKADILISHTADICILFSGKEKRKQPMSLSPIPLFYVAPDSLQLSYSFAHIQILLRYPIIIIILWVFCHICSGKWSSDGRTAPPRWQPKSVFVPSRCHHPSG